MSDRARLEGVRLARSRARRVAALAVAAVRSAGARRRRQACGDVMLNENSWAGSTANMYVAKYVLENEARVQGRRSPNITEGQPDFQAMADGKIDVVLEDWQQPRPRTRST